MSKKSKLSILAYAIIEPKSHTYPNGMICRDTISADECVSWHKLAPNGGEAYYKTLGFKAKKVKITVC